MKLSAAKVKSGLQSLKGWKVLNGRLEKTFKFKTYPECLAFAVKVALAAEKADHHPDSLEIKWGHVRVAYVTHSVGGLTRLDFEAAGKVNQLRR
jgi:4a-hydroxytetrahydrobiopterin dehydratase